MIKLPIKRVLLVLSALFLVINSFAQNEYGGIVKLDHTIHNFGVFLLSDGEQECQFTLENISKKPIIIHKVISSCGCSEAEWTKNPIMPGKKGVIDVVFKNDLGPYPFDKAITVYVSGLSKPIVLRIRGIVQQTPKSLEETYTFHIGNLGMTHNTLNLGQIDQGLARSEEIEVANISNKSINVEFTNLSEGLILSPNKFDIAPKSTIKLRYSIDTKQSSEKKWGKTLFSASVKVDSKLQKEKITVEALIKENFSDYTKEQRRIGALPYLESSSHNIGNVAAGSVHELNFEIKNSGRSELIIYKLDSSEEGVEFEYPNNIAPNEKNEIKVKIDTTGKTGELMYILTIICNSPIRPLVNIFITGNIVE